jgi:V/A-type H+-transporting ATPase subunit I
MFRAQPLYHMTLWCLSSEMQDMALLLARRGVYDPSPAPRTELPDTAGQEYRETYQEARSRLDKIVAQCGPPEMSAMPGNAQAPTLEELKALNNRLGETWRICLEYQSCRNEFEQQRRQLAALEETHSRLQQFRKDISPLLQTRALLKVRIGQVPTSNVHRLREALELAGNLLLPFDHAEGHTFALIAGTPNQEDLGSLLAQAGWRDLPIPQELQTQPEIAREHLKSQREHLQEASQTQCGLMEQTLVDQTSALGALQARLALARPLAESSLGAIRNKGSLTAFSGWIPHKSLSSLKQALNQQFPGRHILNVREPSAQDPSPVPSLLIYPSWLRPYIPLVRSYGVPRYGEFDPALLFAISYLLLFGAMFGDVGHGTALMVLALLLRGKLAWLRPIGLLAGASACLFGVLYGSVFGFENLIKPVWMSPMHDATHMLMLAIVSGIGFIGATFLINIYNHFAIDKPFNALFDGHGVAGLLFYSGAVWGLGNLLHGDRFGPLSAAFAILGLVMIAIGIWKKIQAALAERLLVMLIETVETVTNLFANTLSFLRVAAFSLNHVALAMAVFTLAGSLDTSGHWVTIVLGNVVIIVLEGGIVAIQSLRLMYYEGFSRFFNGDGIEFKPIGIESGRDELAAHKNLFAYKPGS